MSCDIPPVEELLAQRLYWVRPVIRQWHDTLRNPTVGTLLEFLPYEDVGCMRIDTPKAQKLIRRLCF